MKPVRECRPELRLTKSSVGEKQIWSELHELEKHQICLVTVVLDYPLQHQQ